VARTKKEAFLSKAETALIGAGTGASIGSIVGGPIGGTVGAIVGGTGGIIFGDAPIIFNEPMICIPAREQYKLSSNPSYIVYAHAGETIMPTGGNVQDVQEVVESVAPVKTRKKLNAYQRFSKKFEFRSKRKNENQRTYFSLRSKALSKAWAKHKKGGSK